RGGGRRGRGGRRGGRGRFRRGLAGGGRGHGDVGAWLVVGEEIAPAFGHRVRVLDVQAVHLVDQARVRPEILGVRELVGHGAITITSIIVASRATAQYNRANPRICARSDVALGGRGSLTALAGRARRP